MEDDKGSYGASMHGSTLITLIMVITLWTLILASDFLLYFYVCPKTSLLILPQCLYRFISQTYMNSKIIV